MHPSQVGGAGVEMQPPPPPVRLLTLCIFHNFIIRAKRNILMDGILHHLSMLCPAGIHTAFAAKLLYYLCMKNQNTTRGTLIKKKSKRVIIQRIKDGSPGGMDIIA